MALTLGIISDTHGLMRPEALAALEGVAAIIHAGDVGRCEVLDALSAIAPVHAVRGNVDSLPLPETRDVTVGGARIYVLHNLADLAIDPAERGYAAVISGHSHIARSETLGGVLYLNPGAAGPRRFRLPVTLARLRIDGAGLRPEIVTLMGSPASSGRTEPA